MRALPPPRASFRSVEYEEGLGKQEIGTFGEPETRFRHGADDGLLGRIVPEETDEKSPGFFLVVYDHDLAIRLESKTPYPFITTTCVQGSRGLKHPRPVFLPGSGASSRPNPTPVNPSGHGAARSSLPSPRFVPRGRIARD